jgi:hypothetical protein
MPANADQPGPSLAARHEGLNESNDHPDGPPRGGGERHPAEDRGADAGEQRQQRHCSVSRPSAADALIETATYNRASGAAEAAAIAA